jgi:hypothetical protein
LSYKQGFLVHSDDFSQVLYYPSLNAQPQTVGLPDLASGQNIYGLSASGDSLVFASSTLDPSSSDVDLDDPSAKIDGRVTVVSGGETTTYKFDRYFDVVGLCGNNLLCTQQGKNLEVYNIGSEKPKLNYRVGEVEAVSITGQGLHLVRPGGVYGFDPVTASGSLQYSLGSYRFCGLNEQAGGYVLCVISKANRKSALFISPNQANNASIDKKIQRLADDPAVENVSVFDVYIFVSPRLGEPQYNAATNSYGYNPADQARAKAAVEAAITKTGINRSLYKITVTGS